MAVLVDILNPERIVIGSIYARQWELLEPIVIEELLKHITLVHKYDHVTIGAICSYYQQYCDVRPVNSFS